MTETEVPQLHLSRDHIMAMTQLLTMLSQRLAEQRERWGRAAYSNAEHAARIADTQDNPVLRPMTDAERQQFTATAGNPQVPQHGLSVATAPVGQEWGVRAVTPAGDGATVMCQTITEATRLADYLRAQNTPAVIDELNELSEQIGHRVAAETTPGAPQSAEQHTQQDPPQDGLTKGGSLAERAENVPTALTSTPQWQEIEAQFADLTNRGVHPDALAAGVQALDFDRARRPDALVRWSLENTERAWQAEHRSTNSKGGDSTAVTAEWATQLDPTSAVDRAAAAEAVGRYGPDVDATLAGAYPGLLTAAHDGRTMAEWAEDAALSQQQRETAEALTAESTARTLRGDDVVSGLGGDHDIDRQEAAVAQDTEAAEHRGRAAEAGNEAERARDDKVTAQFTPARSQTSTANRTSRRTGIRTGLPVLVSTQTLTRGRGR
jgi:hypothetical protein